MTARLLSINVGMPRDLAWHGRSVRSGILKTPVVGRRMARRLNIDGDGQGDLEGHGGEQRAVLVYQLDSYRYWEHELGREKLSFGVFGENFTVEGLSDDEVCIGDRYRIGDALFEVSQPRVTCYRLGIRLQEPRMAALLVSHHRPGFYLRVLEEGMVGAGDLIVRESEGPERFSVAAIDALLYLPGHRAQDLQRALQIPALSQGWRSSFRALLDRPAGAGYRGGNVGLAPLSGPPPAWRGFRGLRVTSIAQESSTVISLTFTSPDNTPLPVPLPGQSIAVSLPLDPPGPALLRSYSLSGPPIPNHYRISVKLEERGAASSYLHRRTRVGDLVEVSAPRGAFILNSAQTPVVLVGAGIGVTPLVAMLHSLAMSKSTREVWWIYAARNHREHPFADECDDLLRQLPRSCRYIMYSQPDAPDTIGKRFDAHGHLSANLVLGLGVPQNADFYLCGPRAFLQKISEGLLGWGLPQNRLHSEVFGTGSSITPGIDEQRLPPHTLAGPSGDGPLVSFARSGLSVKWCSQYQSLLEIAEACDVPVRWSCRTGVCHTCESGLISGAVTYQPEPLEAPAAGNLLICCSRPNQDVVIDL